MPDEIDSAFRLFIRGRIKTDGTVEDFSKAKKSAMPLDNKCKKCDFFSFCQGDCPVIRLRSKENHDYCCAIKKLLIRDFLIKMVSDTDEYRSYELLKDRLRL